MQLIFQAMSRVRHWVSGQVSVVVVQVVLVVHVVWGLCGVVPCCDVMCCVVLSCVVL